MTVADLLQSKPGPTEGWEVGYGDWRLAVQMLLPTATAAYWGLSRWGIATWSELQLQDVTPWVRGLTWERTTDGFGGRPTIGVGVVTLDNTQYLWSPVDPTNSFGAIVAADAAGPITNLYFGPGTVVRIVAWSPSDATVDGLVPQLTGVVESWPENRISADRESFVEVTFVETLSKLSRVDELALGGVVGDDDTCTERVERLADAAGWPYGYTHSGGDYDSWPLQSTDMANNRLGEIYLTADSVGAVVRTDRSGALLTYAGDAPELGPLPTPVVFLARVDDPLDLGVGPDHAIFAVPDEVVWDNDTEIVVNSVQLARVDGSVQSAEHAPSIGRHGRITFGRNDLICKSDALVLDLAEAKLNTNTLRLRQLQIDGDADNLALAALVSVDIGNTIGAYAAATDGGYIAVAAKVDGMNHAVTPLGDAPIRWTCIYTLGVQDPTYVEAP